MAKFRDLGINAIPITMRPPEMGAGGGGGEEGPTTQCRNTKTCVEDDNTTQCQNVRTCIYDDNTTQCGAGGGAATCVGEETTECDRHVTCRPEYDIPTQCMLGFTCVNEDDDDDDDDDDNKKKKASARGFSPEAVAQLREQLEGRIDDSLEI